MLYANIFTTNYAKKCTKEFIEHLEQIVFLIIKEFKFLKKIVANWHYSCYIRKVKKRS